MTDEQIEIFKESILESLDYRINNPSFSDSNGRIIIAFSCKLYQEEAVLLRDMIKSYKMENNE